MNKIKFRAWNKKLKIMRDVCAIEFDDTGRTEIVKVWDHPSVEAAKIKSLVSCWSKKDCELLQFIGKKDVHGKEIYNKDIVKYIREDSPFKTTGIGLITFSDYSFLYDGYFFGDALLTSIEIVGNMFKNPELLKK